MKSILDYYAQTNTPYLHALGHRGTAYLLNRMQPVPGSRVLEIGYGTGQTLVELYCRFEQIELFGLEKSPVMRAAALRRFKFGGLNPERLLEMPAQLDFPFPDGYFDQIYCESVLSILNLEELHAIWKEVFRVLRPGGSFFFNESLWRASVSAKTMTRINQRCKDWFGIPQASEAFPYPADWVQLAANYGFKVLEQTSLENCTAKLPFKLNFRLFRAKVYSWKGKLKSRFLPVFIGHKKQIGQQIKLLADEPPFLEGIFFHCQKSN